MENFKYVYEMHGITITNASKEDSVLTIETHTDNMPIKLMNRYLEVIKGTDGHIYKLEVVEAKNNNDKKEIRLKFIYLDLSEVEVYRI